MAVSTIKVTLNCNVERIWDIVTSLTDYSWRSDLERIEIIDDKRFIEYSKDGFATTFTVTAKEQYRRWEFDLDNKNIFGHWVGLFTSNGGGQTTIEFTEDVTAKKFFMKPLLKAFLKKRQAQYAEDLKRAPDNA